MKSNALAAGRMERPTTTAIDVGVVCAFAEPTGPGRQLASIAARLAADGVRIRVAVLDRRGREAPPFVVELRSLGIEAVAVADHGPLDLRVVRRTRAIMERWQPAVVQSHGYKATAVAFALRKSGFRAPWVGFYHGATHESRKAALYHRLDRWMLGHAERAVVMSTEQLQLFRGIPNARVIHNAVTPGKPGSAPELPGARPRIGVIGRLSPEKGVDVFLQAVARLAKSSVAFHAVIVGDGPERVRLEELADTLGVQNRVSFMGHVDGVDGIYPQLDLVVIPSRSEGLPNVLLEALAAGRRVVSTTVGAVPDVLTDPAAGTIVPMEDGAALADAVARFLGDTGSDESIRAACRRVLQPFSLDARAEQHVRMYRELVGTTLSGDRE